jgi:hypothetical protein
MLTIREMTRTAGDVEHKFDVAKPEQRADAEKMLADCLARGGAVFAREKPGANPVQVKALDPTHTEILLREQLLGG